MTVGRRQLMAGGLGLCAFGAERAFAQSTAPVATGRLRDDQVEPLLRMLAEAPTHGLDPFDAEPMRARLRSGDAAARDEIRRLSIAYAAAQHGQRVPPSKFDANWGMRPQPYNALLEFDQAVGRDKLKAWIAAQPPPFSHYRTLRDALVTYQSLAGDRAWRSVPAGPDLGVGATGARVRALRERLAFEDPAVEIAGKRATLYDVALSQAVMRFQLRHGVAPTGVVGAGTLRALNATPADRAATIIANLERWRWVPRDRAPDRVEVNIAATELDVYAADAKVDTMLAAAGRPTDQSPLLVSQIGSIVFNPAWHVPKSIANKELLRKGPRYLAAHGFSYQPGNDAAPLIQKPGPHNALGRIKFDFPNRFGVYLHDTPAQAAFTRSSRDVSHGCVRLQHPLELAKRLLASNPSWPPERVDEVLAGDATVRAGLAAPVPVMLFYWTAFDQGPQMAFREDIYGWDAQLLGLLSA